MGRSKTAIGGFDAMANSTAKARRMGRFLLSASVAAAALAAAHPALAQVNATGTAVFGANDPTTSGSTTSVTVNAAEALVDWTATDADVFLPQNSTLEFNGIGGDYTVLNRIDPIAGNALLMDGAVNATAANGSGNVWFYSPTGFVVGANASFDVNGLMFSASPIDSVDEAGQSLFTNPGEVVFGQALNSDASVVFQNGGAYTLGQADSYLAVVAPRIEQRANISVNGSVAYIAAEAATLTASGGLFDISVSVGSEDANGIVHDGTTSGPLPTAPGSGQYFVAVPKNQLMTMLIGGSVGYSEASAVSVNDGRIVLSAGYDVVGGTVDTTSGVAGASMTVHGVQATSAIDAGATDAIALTDASDAIFLLKDARFYAGNTLSLDLGGTVVEEGANLDASDLLLESGGDLTIDLVNGASTFVSDLTALARDSVVATVSDGATLFVDGTLTLGSSVESAGAITAGDVTLTVADGTVDAGGLNLISIARSDTAATGGTVTLETTDPGATVTTIDAVNVWSLGLGNDFNANGSSGTGGTAQVLIGGGNVNLGSDSGALYTLYVRADGGAGVGTDPAGTSGVSQGGTALIRITDGALGSDSIGISASGLPNTLDFDGNGNFVETGVRQAGDGFDAFGGNATFEQTGGQVTGVFNFGSAALAIVATGFGGAAQGSVTAGGTGGTGTGGSASYVQSGGTADLFTLSVDASGMGGAGSDEDVEGGQQPGSGGAGSGGIASGSLTGGSTTAGSVTLRADGNPRRPAPGLGTQAGQGGFARDVDGGDGGDGFGGDALFTVDGGSLLAGVDGNGGALPLFLTLSADGYGGAGGLVTIDVNPVSGGTGGEGQGGNTLLTFAGGALAATNIALSAIGNGGSAGADGSGGSSGIFAGADGGSGMGGTARLIATADLDLNLIGITLDATGSGADGEDSQTGTGGSGGVGAGGDVSLIADGAAVIANGVNLYADGYGGNGGATTAAGATGGAGGEGNGGSVRLAALNGGSFTDNAGFAVIAAEGFAGFGGDSASGTGGAGGDAAGGTVLLDALDGGVTVNGLLLSAVGYADKGGFGSTFGADGTATGGTVAITITGSNTVQIGNLNAIAYGALVESTTAAGTIVLDNSGTGSTTFNSLLFDNGYDSADPSGVMTVISNGATTTVLGNAGFYGAGTLTFDLTAGGLAVGSLTALTEGDLALSCGPAPCNGIAIGTDESVIEASGGIVSDGMIVTSGGLLEVSALGGDIVLNNGAGFTGAPLSVTASGSVLGTGTLASTGDLTLEVGGDVQAGSIVTDGRIVNVFAAPGSTWAVPGSIDVGMLAIAGGDQPISAGGDIAIGDLQAGGNALFLDAGGAVSLTTVSNLSDLDVIGDSIAFDSLTTSGYVILDSLGDVTGGAIDAGGDVVVFADGDLTATSLVSGGSIDVDVNAVNGLDSLTAPGSIFVFTLADQTYTLVDAGGNVLLSSGAGAITVADLSATGFVDLYGTTLDIGSSGALDVDYASAYDGDIVITAAGDLGMGYAEALGDIVLTSTGGDVVVGSLYAGTEPFSEGQGGLAMTIPDPGAGNIALNAAGDVTVNFTAFAPELFGIDAGGTANIFGNVFARLIYIRANDLVLGGQAFLGDADYTQDISLVALGDAGIGSGAFGTFLVDDFELTQMFSAGDFGLAAGGQLNVGDLSVIAGDGLLGTTGNLYLSGTGGIDVIGALLLDDALDATLVMQTGGFLYIDATSGSVRVRANGSQDGSMFLYADTILAASGQMVEDLSGLTYADYTDALGTPDGGDGRSLIEGGSIFVDADTFLVQNTGADTSFAARRGILANSMTVINSGGSLPRIAINGIVNGQTGLDTAFAIGLPMSAAPYSSVNGCFIGFGSQCGVTIPNELIKTLIGEDPPHSVLDGEPRSTIETRIITIDTVEPEGFQPLVDEPVTGTGNDDLWENGALDGKQCPVDVRQDECEEEDGE
ncbi:beta strand repeat-containing protein [Croceicoccus naphthovorans]|nr:hypothetical protein [Croceicoccus naphthovorans]MBB3991575.1 filamentous hemagglutinin family protein [Croceicoccus naphthovorans]